MKQEENMDALLSEINKNLSLSKESLKNFGHELASIARATDSTFDEMAKATIALVRQGLGVEAVRSRLYDILLTKMSSADAVEELTKAIEEFNRNTPTKVVDKFALIDESFAVSSKDLAEAITRVGESAQRARVSMDELIRLVEELKKHYP